MTTKTAICKNIASGKKAMYETARHLLWQKKTKQLGMKQHAIYYGKKTVWHGISGDGKTVTDITSFSTQIITC